MMTMASNALVANAKDHCWSLSGVIAASGFGLWIILPVGNIAVVSIAYCLVFAAAMIRAVSSGMWLGGRWFAFWIISLTVGSVGALVGISNHNLGAQSEIVFFIAIPAVWLLIALGFDLSLVRAVCNLIPVVGFIVGALGVLFWLDGVGFVNVPALHYLEFGQGVGIESYGTAMRFYPISSLLFLIPFLMISLAVQNLYSWHISRTLLWPSVITTLLLMVLSGRRGLIVAAVVSVVVTYLLFLTSSQASRDRKKLLGGVIVIGIISTLAARLTGFSGAALVDSILEESFGVGQSSARAQSGENLIMSWSSSPIFGNGLGATISGPPRSIERPWNFELQYHLILNALGAFGFILFAVITFGVFQRAVRTVKQYGTEYNFIIPIAAGTLSILVANIANPYLHTPGHYWMFFFLVLALNAIERDQGSGHKGKILHRESLVSAE